MSIILSIFIFLFGTAFGSFLNVVATRFNTGKTLGGRSLCPFCSTKLTWKELIPLVSFLVQGGRCKTCKKTISWQYPLIELITGILFLCTHLMLFNGVFDIYYLLSTIYYLLIISLLIIITIYDYHHKIIPNPFVYTLVVLGAINLFVSFPSLAVGIPEFWHVLSAPILFSPFALLWLVSRGRWMGFGDAKLAIAIGWLLGLREGTTAIVLAFWIGAIYFLAIMALKNVIKGSRLSLRFEGLKMDSEVPFGPFLILGILLVLFLEIDLLEMVSSLVFSI